MLNKSILFIVVTFLSSFALAEIDEHPCTEFASNGDRVCGPNHPFYTEAPEPLNIDHGEVNLEAKLSDQFPNKDLHWFGFFSSGLYVPRLKETREGGVLLPDYTEQDGPMPDYMKILSPFSSTLFIRRYTGPAKLKLTEKRLLQAYDQFKEVKITRPVNGKERSYSGVGHIEYSRIWTYNTFRLDADDPKLIESGEQPGLTLRKDYKERIYADLYSFGVDGVLPTILSFYILDEPYLQAYNANTRFYGLDQIIPRMSADIQRASIEVKKNFKIYNYCFETEGVRGAELCRDAHLKSKYVDGAHNSRDVLSFVSYSIHVLNELNDEGREDLWKEKFEISPDLDWVGYHCYEWPNVKLDEYGVTRTQALLAALSGNLRAVGLLAHPERGCAGMNWDQTVAFFRKHMTCDQEMILVPEAFQYRGDKPRASYFAMGYHYDKALMDTGDQAEGSQCKGAKKIVGLQPFQYFSLREDVFDPSSDLMEGTSHPSFGKDEFRNKVTKEKESFHDRVYQIAHEIMGHFPRTLKEAPSTDTDKNYPEYHPKKKETEEHKVADEIKVEFPTAGNVYIPEADRLRIEEEVQLKPYNDRGPRLSPLNKSIYKDHGRSFIGDPCYPDGITSICGNNYYINDNFEVVPID